MGVQVVAQGLPDLTSFCRPRTHSAQPAAHTLPVLRLDGDERTGRHGQLERASPPHPAPALPGPAQPSTKIASCHCPGFGFTPSPKEAKGRGWEGWGWGGQ